MEQKQQFEFMFRCFFMISIMTCKNHTK